MKKLQLIFLAFLSQIFLFSYNSYAIGTAEAEQAQKNTSIILSFFSTEMLLNVLFAIITIVLTFAISKIVTVKLTNYLEDSAADQESNREELVGVLTRTASISILVIGFSVTLGILGVDLGIFMGGIGFGIGFTLKVFLSNFIAGIVMVTQGTYHNGDLIEVNGKTGKITKIHSLFTAVEQFDGVIFYIPNVKFLEENVSNFHSNDKRRVEIEVGVDYNTDITKAKATILQVLSNFPNILQAPKSSIFVEKLDNSSIKLNIRFWINTLDNYFETKSNVTETINLAFKKSDIHVAFPQVTISNRK